MLVNNFLEDSARKYPNKVALITDEGSYNYREIDDIANKIAQALLADNLKKGDRVAIFMNNSLDVVVGLFGILKAGGIFIIINTTAKTEKLAYILNNSRASVLIASKQNLPVIAGACNNTPSLKDIYMAGKDIPSGQALHKRVCSLEEIMGGTNNSRQPETHTIDMDLASIIYTSCSTGPPKGVMMTHFNMVSAANSIIKYLEKTEEDIILNTIPMSFDYGLYQVLMGFKVGATIVFEKQFMYPYTVIDTILREKVTGFPIVPTIAAILLQMDGIKKHDFHHLRYITSTAAALPVAHIDRLKDFFPMTKIYSMYGLTECKRVSYLPPEQLAIRPTSVGKGMPNTEAYIVDQNGDRVGPDMVGELVVRGSNVMIGYWGMPEATAKTLKPGRYSWEKVLYTGDLFKMDKDGYLYFIGRKDDIIKCRGEKVSPKEIENVLSEIDGVVEAAVVGVSDFLLGQAVKAFVVLKKGLKMMEKDVQRYCSQHLEDFMVPKYVEFMDELPKTAAGKIDKLSLI